MTPRQKAERVLATLTKAQCAALLDAYDIGSGYITRFDSFRSARALYQKGLTRLHWSPSSLTDIGLAVRALLLDPGK